MYTMWRASIHVVCCFYCVQCENICCMTYMWALFFCFVLFSFHLFVCFIHKHYNYMWRLWVMCIMTTNYCVYEIGILVFMIIQSHLGFIITMKMEFRACSTGTLDRVVGKSSYSMSKLWNGLNRHCSCFCWLCIITGLKQCVLSSHTIIYQRNGMYFNEVTKYVTTWFSREKPMLATCT